MIPRMRDMKLGRSRTLVVAVAALLLVAVAAATVAVGGVGVAAVDSADRSIDETTAQPGETVGVSVEFTVVDAGERLSITDDFTHVAAAEADGLEHNGEPIDTDVVAVDADTLTVAAETSFEDGDTVTLDYTVTVVEAIDGDETVSFAGTAGIDDQEDVSIDGDSAIDVVPAEPNPVASVERSLDPTGLAAGETATAEVTLELDDDADQVTVFEDYDEVADAAIESVTHEGDPIEPVIDAVDEESLTVALEEPFDAGDTVAVTYSVTVPEDATDGDEFDFDGVGTADDGSDVQTAGDERLTVETEEEPPANDTVAFGDGEFVVSVEETETITMNTTADAAGYQVFVDFDPDRIEIEDIEAVDLDGPLSTDVDNENGTFAAAQAQANSETAPELLHVNVTFVGEAGDTAELTFDEDESTLSASDGRIDVDFEDAELTGGQLGDVNLDGEVDIVDAVLIQQFIANEEPEGDFVPALADVTRDGEIHTGDVIALLDMIVEGGEYADELDEQRDATSVNADAVAAPVA